MHVKLQELVNDQGLRSLQRRKTFRVQSAFRVATEDLGPEGFVFCDPGSYVYLVTKAVDCVLEPPADDPHEYEHWGWVMVASWGIPASGPSAVISLSQPISQRGATGWFPRRVLEAL